MKRLNISSIIFLALAVLLASFFVKAQPPELIPLELVLKESVLTVTAPVTIDKLFDLSIVDLSMADETLIDGNLVKAIKNKVLIFPRYRQWFERQDLQALLQQQLGIKTLKLTGKNKVLIQVCQPLDQQQITNRVQAQFNEYYRQQYRVSQLKLITDKQQCLASKVVSIALAKREKPNRRLLVSLQLASGAEREIWFDLAFNTYTPYAQKTLRKSTLIQAEDINWKWSGASSQARNNANSKVGNKSHNKSMIFSSGYRYQTKQKIAKGKMLSPKNIQVLQAINNGEQVIVLSKYKGIFIETQGKAMTNGQIGDQINVLVEGAAATVSGTVLEIGKVKV